MLTKAVAHYGGVETCNASRAGQVSHAGVWASSARRASTRLVNWKRRSGIAVSLLRVEL